MIKQYMSALFEESTLKKPKEIGSSNESQALRAASKKERRECLNEDTNLWALVKLVAKPPMLDAMVLNSTCLQVHVAQQKKKSDLNSPKLHFWNKINYIDIFINY